MKLEEGPRKPDRPNPRCWRGYGIGGSEWRDEADDPTARELDASRAFESGFQPNVNIGAGLYLDEDPVVEEEPVSKVTFDKMNDFKFIAAYEAYSRLFDRSPNPDDKRRLNGVICKLNDGEMSYSDFYFEINRYQEDAGGGRGFEKTKIQGQRKRDYRRNEQKVERIKRHKR